MRRRLSRLFFYRELNLPRCVSTAEGEFWSRHTTVTELEGQLDPQIFLRIHRQAIVNLNHIREIGACQLPRPKGQRLAPQQLRESVSGQLYWTRWAD
jgi:hypothetical protein